MHLINSIIIFTLGSNLGMAFHIIGTTTDDGNGDILSAVALTLPVPTPGSMVAPAEPCMPGRRRKRGGSIEKEQRPTRSIALAHPSQEADAGTLTITPTKVKRAETITDATPFLLSPPGATDTAVGDINADTSTGEDWWPYSNDGGTFAPKATSEMTTADPQTAPSTMVASDTSTETSKAVTMSNTGSDSVTLISSTSSEVSATTTATDLAQSISSTSNNKLRIGLIVPIAFAALLVIGIVGSIVICHRRKQRKQRIRANLLLLEEEAFDDEDEGSREVTSMLAYGAGAGQAGSDTRDAEKRPNHLDVDEKDRMMHGRGETEVSHIQGNWTMDDEQDENRPNPYALKRATELTHAFGWRETLHRAQGDATENARASARPSMYQVPGAGGGAVSIGLGVSNGIQNFRRRVSGPSDEAVYQRLNQADEQGGNPTSRASPAAALSQLTYSPAHSSRTASPVATPESKAARKSNKHMSGGIKTRLFQRSKAVHPTQSSPGAFKITPRKGDDLIAGRAYSEIPEDAAPAPRMFETASGTSASRDQETARREIMPHGGTPTAQVLSPELRPSMFFAPMDGLGLRSPADTLRSFPDEPSPDMSMYSDATGMTGMDGLGFSDRGLEMIGLRSPGETSIMPTPRDKVGAGAFSALPPSTSGRAVPRNRYQQPSASVRVKPSSRPPPSRSTLKVPSSGNTNPSVRYSASSSPASTSADNLTPRQAALPSPEASSPSHAAPAASRADPPATTSPVSHSAFDRRTNRKLLSTQTETKAPAGGAPSNGLKRTSAFNGLSSTGTPLIHGETIDLHAGGATEAIAHTATARPTSDLSRSTTTSTKNKSLASPLQKRMDLVRKTELKDALGGANLNKRISDASRSTKSTRAETRQGSPTITAARTSGPGTVERMVQAYPADGPSHKSQKDKVKQDGSPLHHKYAPSPGVDDGIAFGQAMSKRAGRMEGLGA